MSPRLHDALRIWNTGSTTPSAMSRPAPSSPSRAVDCTETAWTGLDALPRSPNPSNGAPTFNPLASAGTSQRVAPAAAVAGRLVHTYESASPAEVTQLLLASSTPSAVAVDRGAQNWLREPVSEKASVEKWVPAAMARRVSSGPCASIAAVAQ